MISFKDHENHDGYYFASDSPTHIRPDEIDGLEYD